MDATAHVSSGLTIPRQAWNFTRHYLEMCIPMCIGFGVGDLIYFWAAGRAGYTEPFSQLPELSLLVVTVSMTAPSTAWMAFRRMQPQLNLEMTAAMAITAALILVGGSLALVERSSMALLMHVLGCTVGMLVPMAVRLGAYTGRDGHVMGHGEHGS